LKHKILRTFLTKFVCSVISILLKNGEICDQKLKIFQGHPQKENTIFLNLKQMCNYLRLSSLRLFLYCEVSPRCCYLKTFNDLHTLSNIIGEWSSSLVQRCSTNVAENAIMQYGGQLLVSAFTLVINGIMFLTKDQTLVLHLFLSRSTVI
jgi:hypothetical protein